MRAIVHDIYGSADVARLDDVPVPVPGPGEVLVRISAAALNRLDIFVRNGMPGVPVAFPHVPGADGCGTIEALGAYPLPAKGQLPQLAPATVTIGG